jgi:hypothetical protein
MSTTAKAGGSDFPKAPIGTHVARCYQVIDLGHQKVEWEGKIKWTPKVLISWELLGDERMEDGKPFAISSRYTLSLSEKSVLAPMLEAWRGQPFTVSEKVGFDIKNVLGAYCMLNVVHNPVGDKVYANVSAVMALPKGTPRPAPVNKNLYFNIDEDAVSDLPTWLQNIVMKAQEKQGQQECDDFMQATKRTFEEEMGSTDIPF